MIELGVAVTADYEPKLKQHYAEIRLRIRKPVPKQLHPPRPDIKLGKDGYPIPREHPLQIARSDRVMCRRVTMAKQFFQGKLAMNRKVIMAKQYTSKQIAIVIVKAAARTSKYTFAEIMSDAREPGLVFIRHRCWGRTKRKTLISLMQIGRIFHRDHTTILNAFKKPEIRTELRLPSKKKNGA